MQEETQSILIPTSYSLEYAREIVTQMKKDITNIKVFGDYYIYFLNSKCLDTVASKS